MMSVMMLVILVRLTRGQGDVVELQHRQFAQIAAGTCEAARYYHRNVPLAMRLKTSSSAA